MDYRPKCESQNNKATRKKKKKTEENYLHGLGLDRGKDTKGTGKIC